jgi:hypothetical protein
VDDLGYIYVAGETNSIDYETTEGAFQETYQGGAFDGFIAKLDPSGREVIWSTFLGGRGWDAIHRQNGLALGPDGSLYVTGWTHSPDFPTRKAFDSEFGAPWDAFVARFTPDGELMFSTFLGGNDGPLDAAKAIVVDDEGSAYITGQMSSSDFPVEGGLQTENGVFDAFLAKVSSTGEELLFSTYLGGSGNGLEDGQSVALGEDGLVYVAGITEANDFPTTPRAFQPKNPGARSLFVTAIDVPERAIEWSTYLGGKGHEGALSLQAASIAVDQQEHVYVAGSTESSDFPTTAQAMQQEKKGGSDVIVSKLRADGSGLVYSTLVGGGKNDVANTILVDRYHRAYVVGKTYSEDLFSVPDASLPRGGGSDGFVFFLSPSGHSIEFSGYLGGAHPTDGTPAEIALAVEESAIAATLDNEGAMYITGIASSPGFTTSDGSSVSGAWDAYVLKISNTHPSYGAPYGPR